MAGLSDLIASTKETSTELPSWYQSAQQSTVDQARNVNVPAPEQTVGQQAVGTLSGAQNPFAQAGGYLSDIAGGAANPWTVDASGTVSPNTNTALGGLFAAQRQYMDQILPEVDAQSTASAIGGGNFGSLRGLTAMNKARGDVLAKMNADQYKAAQEAQTQGIQASSAMGNVGQQGIENALKTAEWQQTSPLAKSVLMGKVLGGVGKVGETQTAKTNLSPLAQAKALATMAESPAGKALMANFGVQGNNFGEMLSGILGKIGMGSGNSIYQVDNTAQEGDPGFGWQYFSDGTSISPDGSYYKGDQMVYSPSMHAEEPVYDSGAYGDYSGGDFGGYDTSVGSDYD